MPTAKLSVTHLMDHGLAEADSVFFKPAAAKLVAASPEEMDLQLMATTGRLTATKVDMELVKVVVAAGSPAQVAAQLIQARYAALGGASGFLGAAKTNVTLCPDKIGYFRHYAGGSIYWSPRSGAHEVYGDIRALWSSLGWERSFLGYPRTGELPGRDEAKKGRYSVFEGGVVYWHPQTGAHEVHGAILAKYRELGAEASFLGYPTTHETGTPDGVGRFNHFQGGSIYWTPRTWAHEVHGLIRGYWASKGWERNAALGYPISDERIPDRSVGFRPVDSLRKPFLAIPLDVVALPAEQPSPTFTSPVAVVSVASVTPKATATRKTTTTATAAKTTKTKTTTASAAKVTRVSAARSAATTAVRAQPKLVAVEAVKTGPLVATATVKDKFKINPALLARDYSGPSRDRFSDFENGVVFWSRGSAAAQILAPRAKAPNGAKMAWTGAEVAALVFTRLKSALGSFPGATLKSVGFIGVTDYSWDGAGVHNREHRLRVTLAGKRKSGNTLVPAELALEVQVEIGLDPVDREVCGYVTGWRILSSPGAFHGGGDLGRALHARLDPHIWRQFLVAAIPGGAKSPAVLSVKTLPDGRVAVYFEP